MFSGSMLTKSSFILFMDCVLNIKNDGKPVMSLAKA